MEERPFPPDPELRLPLPSLRGITVNTRRPHAAQPPSDTVLRGQTQGESCEAEDTTRILYMWQIQRETKRLSTRWAQGGLAGLIRAEGEDVEPEPRGGREGLSLCQKYLTLTQQLYTEMLQEQLGESLWPSVCGEWTCSVTLLRDEVEKVLSHNSDTGLLLCLPNANRSYRFGLWQLMGPIVKNPGVRGGDMGRNRAQRQPQPQPQPHAQPQPKSHPQPQRDHPNTNVLPGPTSLTLLLELQSLCNVGAVCVWCGGGGGTCLACWYSLIVAEAEDTFELSALAVGVAEVVQGDHTAGCDGDEARSELLANLRLQEFVCRGSGWDPRPGTPSHQALVSAGPPHSAAQSKVVEQICENHQLERLVALEFLYTRMMSPQPEPLAESQRKERRDELRQQYLHHINGAAVEECVVVGMLWEAFTLCWENAVRTRAPFTRLLSDLQLRQRAQLTYLLPQSLIMDLGDLMNLELRLRALQPLHPNLTTVLLDVVKERPSDAEPVNPATKSVTMLTVPVTVATEPMTVATELVTMQPELVTTDTAPVTVVEEPVTGLWDLEGHRLHRERNLLLVSELDQEVVRRSLVAARRRAQDKQLQDRDRQTLQVQARLSRAQCRSAAEWPEEQLLHHQPPNSSRCSLTTGDTGRGLVRERLELLQHDRSLTLKSRGQRNTDRFWRLCEAVGDSEDPHQTPGATIQRDSNKVTGPLTLIATPPTAPTDTDRHPTHPNSIQTH